MEFRELLATLECVCVYTAFKIKCDVQPTLRYSTFFASGTSVSIDPLFL